MENTYDLERFITAQKADFAAALQEIRAGEKRSHWIWYCFPQLRGLGSSYLADYFGIRDLREARAYWADPVLRGNLVELTEALLALPGGNIRSVMGYPDDLKLRSCMTLFEIAAGETDGQLFARVLEKYYSGQRDSLTLKMLGR